MACSSRPWCNITLLERLSLSPLYATATLPCLPFTPGLYGFFFLQHTYHLLTYCGFPLFTCLSPTIAEAPW